ncbi:hypothetical protein MNB_SM-6-819 [hydrothermal vent metagenome]|uniref:DUF1501 domain-containing protein n=1 Tax=hydrothermal vent metagenome TaxID=652676 RepID=A0A1W1CK49_9ZZZZ
MKRREFLKYAAAAGSIGAYPQVLSASNNPTFSDFKAIVMVDLQGGNDALNSFIPTGSDAKTGYNNYVEQRSKSIAIPNKDLMDNLRNLVSGGALQIGSPSDNPYYIRVNEAENYMKGFYLLDKNNFDSKIAINAMMPELAYWMDQGRGAVIQNVGNISAPYNKSDLQKDTGKLPPSIFAHNVQNLLAHLGYASSMSMPTGWLGKLADQWGNVNGNTIYKMNINLSSYGIDHAMFGANTRPMNYSYLGPTKLDRSIHNDFEAWVNKRPTASQDIFRKLHMILRGNSYNETLTTSTDWDNLNKNNPFENVADVYGNLIYQGRNEVSKAQMGIGNPINDRVVESFKTAAKLIAIAKNKGFKRIVLSIVVPGFDQHSNLKQDHSLRIRGLSYGIDTFMRAMDSQGWLDEVLVASLSDFSRSTASNGDGSDHAWGGAQFVLGAVNPGNYGVFPDLTVGGDQDISKRGRLIPTTSYSQYYGEILKWFGASSDEIGHALPELKNFTSVATNLNFMKS